MFKYLTIIILFNFLAIPCIAKQSDYTEITDPTERLYVTGISFLPPSGENWHYQKINPAHINLGKVVANKKIDSLVGMIITHKIPEIDPENESDFLKKISKERWKGIENRSRYKTVLIDEKISHEKEVICVRFHTKLEDYGSKYLTKSIPYFIVEDIGLVCRHPNDNNVGVTIGLSLRVEPDNYLENFPEIANSFLATANFEPLTLDEEKFYFQRSVFLYDEKQYKKSIKTLEKIIELNPDNLYALNNLAWVLATCTDPNYRNGKKAIRLAQRALKLDSHPYILSTLAAAYAEFGNFKAAQNTQQKAIVLYRERGDNKAINDANIRLSAYQMNKPWRE